MKYDSFHICDPPAKPSQARKKPACRITLLIREALLICVTVTVPGERASGRRRDGGCGVIRTVQTSDKYENELIFSGTHSSARVDEQSPTADIVIQPFLGELRARFRDRSSPLRPTSLAVHGTPAPQVGRHYYRVGSSHVKHDRLKEVGKFLQNHLLTSANTNSSPFSGMGKAVW